MTEVQFGFSKRFFILAFAVVLCIIGTTPVVMCSWMCSGCSGSSGVWDPTTFLNSDVPLVFPNSAGTYTANGDALQNTGSLRSISFPINDILTSPSFVANTSIILDATSPNETEYIKGAVNLPASSMLMDETHLLDKTDIENILSLAGITQDDEIVIYGDPADASLLFLVLRYMGMEHVSLMDGDINDWKALSRPVDTKPSTRDLADFEASSNYSVYVDLKSYNDSGNHTEDLLVDCRSFAEYAKDHVSGTINIDYRSVLDSNRFVDANDLSKIFGHLEPDLPVIVVYNDLKEAAVLWYGLVLMGYDAKVMSIQDVKVALSKGGNVVS